MLGAAGPGAQPDHATGLLRPTSFITVPGEMVNTLVSWLIEGGLAQVWRGGQCSLVLTLSRPGLGNVGQICGGEDAACAEHRPPPLRLHESALPRGQRTPTGI